MTLGYVHVCLCVSTNTATILTICTCVPQITRHCNILLIHNRKNVKRNDGKKREGSLFSVVDNTKRICVSNYSKTPLIQISGDQFYGFELEGIKFNYFKPLRNGQ